MENSIKELSQYRFERAKEDYETAEANLKDGRLKASLNRSYYAIFHYTCILSVCPILIIYILIFLAGISDIPFLDFSMSQM